MTCGHGQPFLPAFPQSALSFRVMTTFFSMSFSLIASRYAPYPLSFGLLQAPFNLLSKKGSRTSSYGEFFQVLKSILFPNLPLLERPVRNELVLLCQWICQRISSPVAL